MYMGIALASLTDRTQVNEKETATSLQEVFRSANEKIDKRKAEKAAAKSVKEAAKASKKAAKAAKKAEGAFSAGVPSAPEGVVKTAFKAEDVAAAKTAVASVFHTSISEVLNQKSQAGDFGPGKEDYLSFHRELATEMVAELKRNISQEDLAPFGGVEALDEFCRELLEVQGVVEEPVQVTTVTDVSVKSIDPDPEGMSIRAGEILHEVPSSMEGLQADVRRLAEKFGK